MNWKSENSVTKKRRWVRPGNFSLEHDLIVNKICKFAVISKEAKRCPSRGHIRIKSVYASFVCYRNSGKILKLRTNRRPDAHTPCEYRLTAHYYLPPWVLRYTSQWAWELRIILSRSKGNSRTPIACKKRLSSTLFFYLLLNSKVLIIRH